MKLPDLLGDYEFDVVGVYMNFGDRDISDSRYLLDVWCRDNKLDLREVQLVYNEPKVSFLKKYALHSRLENLSWLQTIGKRQHNFFDENDTSLERGYQELFNYVEGTKSIVIFIGVPKGLDFHSYQGYLVEKNTPIIKIDKSGNTRIITK